MAELAKKKLSKEFFSDHGFKALLVVVAVAFIVRLYYLITTSSQAMWWDEAEYMSAAKLWGMGVPYELNEQRPPLFQLLAAGLVKLGFGETALKFLLVLIPSIALVIAVYYLGKELYDYKIGLIAAIGTAFVWSLIFWSVRFQPDFFSVTFQVIALLFFWKLIKSDNRKYGVYAGIFAAAGFYFKISALLVPVSMVLFVLYKDGWQAVKQKKYWIVLGAFVVGMIPFMIWQTVTFGSPLAFGATYSGDFNEGRSPGWMTLWFYYSFKQPQYSFPKILVFAFFIVGLLATLLKTIFTIDIVVKDKTLRKDQNIFSFIVLLVITLFYIFYIQGTIEDRWVFLTIPFIFFFAGKTILWAYNKVKAYSQILAVLLMVAILFGFSIPQLSHASELINSKKGSYAPVKEASLIIKENSQPEDKILSVSYTQTTAYAEREVITYSKMSIENFTKILVEQKPAYLIVSILEPHHPDWMIQQVSGQSGFSGVIMQYLNSSIIISSQNQIVQFDVKETISRDGATFKLIYPRNNEFGGLFAYKISYE